MIFLIHRWDMLVPKRRITFLNGDFIGAQICHDLFWFFIYTHLYIYIYVIYRTKITCTFPEKDDSINQNHRVPSLYIIEQKAWKIAMSCPCNYHNLWTILGMLLANCPPGNLTWNLKISHWKRRLLFWKPSIFRFHVKFRGVSNPCTPKKTNMTMENAPSFEDVSPHENGDFFHVNFSGM